MERGKSSKSSSIHVVFLPCLGFGHMIPHHQLATAMAKAGVYVSYVSTPKNIQRLPKTSPSLEKFFNYVELKFPASDSNPLPEGSGECTADFPKEEWWRLAVAYSLLQHPFKQFIAKDPPDWIVIDFVNLWAPDIAGEYGIPVLYFGCVSAAAEAVLGPPQPLIQSISLESLTSPPEWLDFPSSVAFRPYEAFPIVQPLQEENSNMSFAERLATTVSRCQVVAVRSCRELEGEYLSSYEHAIGKPVIPLGLLPPPEKEEKSKGRELATGEQEPWGEIFEWLDGQKKSSVVFVGFGSQSQLPETYVHEIAHGLEQSKLPFLWVLNQKPNLARGGDGGAEIKKHQMLPPDFCSDRGRVCTGWAPQPAILGHPSVGAFLFHSGWGSALESLHLGDQVLLVLLPNLLDQCLNARLLVDKGLAIEVERSQDDGSFRRDDIARALRRAMAADSEEAEKMKARLTEAAAIVRDRKLHDRYIEEFVRFLMNGVALPPNRNTSK